MIRKLARFVKHVLIAAGIVAVGLVALCFTSAPWHLYQWLGQDSYALPRHPDCIVIMGGGGIPSESGLMRTYVGAAAAREFPKARIIVALPADSINETGNADRMQHELVIREINAERITRELKGRNTREQALEIARIVNPGNSAILLVTSPEHVKRALKAFRKAGYRQIAGRAAYQVSVESDLLYRADSLGGSKAPVPDVGGKLMLRYTFWNNARYLCDSSRELCALAYYKLKGWI